MRGEAASPVWIQSPVTLGQRVNHHMDSMDCIVFTIIQTTDLPSADFRPSGRTQDASNPHKSSSVCCTCADEELGLPDTQLHFVQGYGHLQGGCNRKEEKEKRQKGRQQSEFSLFAN